jgi:hypothetical protein
MSAITPWIGIGSSELAHKLCDHAGDGRLERVDGFGVLDFHQRLALLDPVAHLFEPLNNSALAHAHALQRLSAILNLRWDDVDFAKGMIRWRAEHDKGPLHLDRANAGGPARPSRWEAPGSLVAQRGLPAGEHFAPIGMPSIGVAERLYRFYPVVRHSCRPSRDGAR